MLLARTQRARDRLPTWVLSAVGIAGGLASLNNPDFGTAAAITLIVVVAVVEPSWPARARGAGVVALSALAPFAAYWLATAALGAPAHWSDWLMYQRVFGAAGYLNVPMPTLGWHVGAVSLFVIASMIGFAGVLAHREQLNTRPGRRSLILLSLGVWCLLTTPYYAGRSMTSTVSGTFALQIGLLVASLIPLIAIGTRLLQARKRSGRLFASITSVTLGVVAIAFLLAALLRVPPPGDLASRPSGALLSDQTASWNEAVQSAPPAFRAALRSGSRVRQVLAAPSVSALTLGVPSGSAFNTPEVLGISPRFTARSCRALATSGASYLVVPSAFARPLASDPACKTLLSAERPFNLFRPGSTTDPAFTVIPLRDGSVG